MDTWPAQYFINVTDIERSIGFYNGLGLSTTNRTEIPQALEAVLMDGGGKGGKLQLAQQVDQVGPIDHGNALWKLYILTNDIAAIHQAAVDQGAEVVSAPQRLDRWPVTVSFVRDPDGYLVEFVQQDPSPDGDSTTYAWVGQYCIYVTDLEATIQFYELLGLTLAHKTEIDHAYEAVLHNPGHQLNRVQLAQPKSPTGPIDMGSAIWKLYFLTDDCDGVYKKMVAGGYKGAVEPARLERWPATIAFVSDPDGYQIELVQLHESD